MNMARNVGFGQTRGSNFVPLFDASWCNQEFKNEAMARLGHEIGSCSEVRGEFLASVFGIFR